jgi:hypothetical protein
MLCDFNFIILFRDCDMYCELINLFGFLVLE